MQFVFGEIVFNTHFDIPLMGRVLPDELVGQHRWTHAVAVLTKKPFSLTLLFNGAHGSPH